MKTSRIIVFILIFVNMLVCKETTFFFIYRNVVLFIEFFP